MILYSEIYQYDNGSTLNLFVDGVCQIQINKTVITTNFETLQVNYNSSKRDFWSEIRFDELKDELYFDIRNLEFAKQVLNSITEFISRNR